MKIEMKVLEYMVVIRMLDMIEVKEKDKLGFLIILVVIL